MILKKDALEYHSRERRGKIEVHSTKPCSTQYDLSLAYTPGVAEPCREIHRNIEDVYQYTSKGNLVAVVTNGSAVLGLGNIGPEAGKPVMEGKGILFKRFADIDVFDLELKTEKADDIIKFCQLVAPTFGGINLEDIKAPECFYIEQKLKETLDIPVFHDDQHGTAIISAAALLNALEIVKKDIDKINVVFSGAGAAAIACARLYCRLGVKHENLFMVDSAGVIYKGREKNMNEFKEEFARDTKLRTMADVMKDADVFVGLSGKDMISPEMIKTMAHDPIVFAMANPDPEISYPDAMSARKDVIAATGRSDYPNQINNVLGFPFIFRGALDTWATTINEEMKIAAVKALAALAKEEVPETVAKIYEKERLKFGREYLIPKPFDSRILVWEASAVAEAAIKSGVARRQLDLENYRHELTERVGLGHSIIRVITEKARSQPKRVVFPEGESVRILKACHRLLYENLAKPILLGNEKRIAKIAEELELNLNGAEIIDPQHSNKCVKYAGEYYKLRRRRGITMERALRRMRVPIYHGMMMLMDGECDAVISGIESNYPTTIRPALEIIPLAEGVTRVSGLFAMVSRDKVYMIADTTVNINPSAEELAEIALNAAKVAERFNIEPRIAMLSFSNFGSARLPESIKVAKAVEILHKTDPDLMVDGEVQADIALMPEYIQKHFPFSKLKKEANILICPDLNAGNVAYKLLQSIGKMEAVGPILMGLSKPVHVLHQTQTVGQIVDMAAIAVVDAQQG
jgi:malate dehydrogenase (oxaloacetate-decarboxylating)(NADP+)